MSLLRSVETNNLLPQLIYFERFFEQYSDYFKKELIKNNSLRLNPSIGSFDSDYKKFINTKVIDLEIAKSDVTLMQESQRLMRYIDGELTMIKSEARRLFNLNKSLNDEIGELENLVTKRRKEVFKLKNKQLFWDALFKIRNYRIKDSKTNCVYFFPDEDQEIQETFTNDNEKLYLTVQNLIRRNKYELALSYIQEKKNEEKEDISEKQATLSALLGTIYHEKCDYKNAVLNLQNCLEIRQKIYEPSHKNIGIVLYNLALLSIKNDNLSKACEYIKAADIIINNKFNNHINNVRLYELSGKIFDLNKAPIDAIVYYNKSLEILEQLNQKETLFYCYILGSLCKCYIKINDRVNIRISLDKYSKIISSGFNNPSKENETTLLGYLESRLIKCDGIQLYEKFGNIEKYDVANYLEVLLYYFQDSGDIITAIEYWKRICYDD